MLNSFRLQKKSKGAAMVEFAIVLPLLLIIMIGVLEVSLFLIQDNTLNKSVRESSRYLARNLGLQGCYTSIAQNVVAYNMQNLFASTNNNLTSTYMAETICVNDSTGAISNPAELTGASCASVDPTCASGSHLHVRVRATFSPRMVTPVRVIPGWANLSFSPILSATSIMRVQ